MSNSFINATVVAQAALAHLYENTVMLPLVDRQWDGDFTANSGDTVTVRKPAVLTSSLYNGSTITVQNIQETSDTLVLDKHRDVSVRVSSKELALNIQDFNTQVLQPALVAIAEDIDRDILSLRSSVSQTIGQGSGVTHWSDPKVLVDARTTLSRSPNNVPMTPRYAVVSPEIAGEWLQSDLFAQAQQAGDTQAIIDASLGVRRFGFTPIESQNIWDNQGVCFHPSAFQFVTRPLPLPQGTVDARIENYNGLGLRVVFGYDMNLKSVVMSIDILYGVKSLAPNRAVIIDGTPS